MGTPAEAASDFGYYPRTMIDLAVIAYSDIASIPPKVEALGMEVVWGPAQLVRWDGITYSLAYIAHRRHTHETTVVIRGTTVDSWSSWTLEDFDVGTTQPFNQLAPHAPADALVSQGTFNGVTDLLKLTDPATGLGIVEFLQATNPRYLYVAGHSLGGTLTPPLFACLNDRLYGGGYVHNMALFAFAGLTPGDAGFARYFNSLSNPEFPWRYHNTLDLAPFCFWSLPDIQNLYVPWGLYYGFPEDDLLNPLFQEAAGIGYTQPLGDYALQGVFDTSIVDEYVWAAQAMHQHHGTTYQALVKAAFPPTAFVNFKGILQSNPSPSSGEPTPRV